MQKRRYITTTLPYANSSAHIGHEFEFTLADALARYFKRGGLESSDRCFFNIGLDEHGLKIQQAAEKAGVTPQEYVDDLLYDWEEFLEKLEIRSWDSFYRTSYIHHSIRVQKFWKEAVKRGDIYKKKYKGTYCVGCEAFKTDRELEIKTFGGIDPALDDPKVHILKTKTCPDHPTTILQEIEEENYFFKLSKYRRELLDWFNSHTTLNEFLEPTSKKAELKKIIENIEDISVSRDANKVSWGIPVPGDSSQTIYVWFDALLNYIFAVGYVNDEDYDEDDFDFRWNQAEVVQICGPDNLKFQAVIFQGLLASAGIKKTDKLLVHGTILDASGRKMSKTLGNVIDPIDQVNKYGVDAVRYYTLAGLSTYKNSSWDENRLVELYNSHLADDFGNLVTRVSVLAKKALDKFKDDPNIELDHSLVKDDKFCTLFDQAIENHVKFNWDNYLVYEALQETNKLVKSLNYYINEQKPWEDLEKGWSTILELHYCLSRVVELYYPVIPSKAGEIRRALARCEKVIFFPKIELQTETE